MCERWPGPRCNDKCKNRDTKKELLYQISRVHSRESIEYKKALAELLSSQDVYDTTPRGIKELSESISTDTSGNNIQQSRFVKGKATRMLQTEALKEIDEGRVKDLATIINDLDSTFSIEELETIIAASRENREKAIIGNLIMDVVQSKEKTVEGLEVIIDNHLKTSGDEYYEYVNKIKESIHNEYGTNVPKHVIAAINRLDDMLPPNKVNLHAYRSIGNAIEKSKQQLSEEFDKISAIQDTSPKTVAEYFDAYRKNYTTEYASLAPEQQPNPPKDWIEGDLPSNGLTKAESSFFIPRDPATVYAIYKLRTDLNAIPDYLKQSTKIAAIDDTDEGFTVKYMSRTGKELNVKTFTDRKTLTDELNKDTKDTVLIFKDTDDLTTASIKDKNRIISLPDIAAKHFDIQAKDSKTLSETFKTSNDTLNLYGAMRKRILKTWGTKPTRTQSTNLDFKPTFNTRSTRFVR